MRLTFIGADGSLGFRTGQTYRLNVQAWGAGVRITAPTVCPYASQAAFWENWEIP